jgi:Predicted permeases
MKIIHRYLIKKFVGPFVLTFFFALVILLMQYLWLYIDELVGKGLEISIILEWLLYASATMMDKAAPLAILISSLMTFGGLGEKYELVALKSAGISLGRLMLPLVFFCIVIGGVSFWFSDQVTPMAWYKMKSLFLNIKEQKPALSIEEGTFYDGFENVVIRVGKKHRDNETIEDVLIYDHSNHQGNTTMTYAKRGKMTITPDGRYLLFLLQEGFFWDESGTNTNSAGSPTQYPLTRARFDEQYKRFDLSSFAIQDTENTFYKSNTKAMPISELNVQIDTIKKEIGKIAASATQHFFNNIHSYNYVNQMDSISNDTINSSISVVVEQMEESRKDEVSAFAKQVAENSINTISYAYDEVKHKNNSLWSHQIEWHRKFTIPVTCLLFFFIGASLGSIVRKGGIGVPLLITVIFFITYFAVSILGEKIAKGSYFPVHIGMWLSTIILLPICIFLTAKATVDSSVMSAEEYQKWIRKINIFKKK